MAQTPLGPAERQPHKPGARWRRVPATSLVDVPPEVQAAVAGERIDFVVKAKRRVDLRTSLVLLFVGVGLLAFMSLFFAAFFGPILLGGVSEFELNGEPVEARWGDWHLLWVPAFVIGIFTLIALGVLVAAIVSFLLPGKWFVGTARGLVIVGARERRVVDWEQFSGDVLVRGDDATGTLTLGLRTGRMVSSKNGPPRYVPDTIVIPAVAEAYAIEGLVRQRVRENDPTPPA